MCLRRALFLKLYVLVFLCFFYNCKEVASQSQEESKDLKLWSYTIYNYNDMELLIKETDYGASGKPSKYRTFKYDSLNRLVENGSYVSGMNPLFKNKTIWNADSTPVKKLTYEGGVSLASYVVYEYADKKEKRILYYNGQDQLERVNEIERDKDGNITRSTFKKDNEVLFFFKQVNADKKEILTHYNKDAHKTGSSEFIYDKDHHLIKRINKDSLERVVQTIEWGYEQNKLNYFTVFNTNGIYSKDLYYYDKNGKLEKSEFYLKPSGSSD